MVTEPCSEQPREEPGSFRERLSLLEAAIPGAATEVQPLLRHIYRRIKPMLFSQKLAPSAQLAGLQNMNT